MRFSGFERSSITGRKSLLTGINRSKGLNFLGLDRWFGVFVKYLYLKLILPTAKLTL